MRSQRRLRLYVVVVVVFLVAFTYFTTDTGGGIQSHRFYKKTVTAIDNAHTATTKKNNEAKEAKDRSHIQRLDLENNNNNNNGGTRKTTSSPNGYNEKQEKPVGSGHGKIDDSEEISVAGRTKMSVPKPKDDQIQLSEKKPEVVDKPVDSKAGVATEEHEISKEEEEEREAKAELDSILKRSPIIVFSKSYCPFSKKAKSILSQYNIVPAPYIVELDKHELGPHLQKLLGTITGRRTVPNVLVNGKSIGGGDDVEALDRDDELISKIKSIAGKSIMEIERLPAAEEVHETEHEI